MQLEPGLSSKVDLVVAAQDTAESLGSGDVPVLATPRIIALVEQASLAAVAPAFDNGTTTVGYRVQLDHMAPTPIGEKVSAEAVLETIEGRRLTFRVSVSDEHQLVAVGRVTRVIVDRARFLAKTTP